MESNVTLFAISHDYLATEIITVEKEKFITPRILKEFEFYFQNISFFVRINRGVILNTKFIKSYSKDFPCMVEMETGFSFEISRRKKSEVLGLLEVL